MKYATLARRCFWPYVALIFTLTHWPNLQVPNPVPRTDIFVHMCVFGLWTVLAGLCGFFGPVFSARNIVRTGIAAALYAAFDEGTQAFEFVHRHAGWDDYSANVLGVLAGCGTLWLVSRTALGKMMAAA
ncbi:MAG: hypothetical protein JSR77_14495 [Planctomycetes bacterium]|nr:hypothetical protein [Planctomycetota bacterium]